MTILSLRWAIVSVVFAGLLAGCLPDFRRGPPSLEVALRSSPREAAATNRNEIVFIDSAQVERPKNDPFTSRELWEASNEQCVALEQMPILEQNGLRVCRLAKPLPPRLIGLLGSRRATTGPRRQRVEMGKQLILPLGERRAECTFEISTGETRRKVTLRDAQCQLEITPRLDEEGQLILRFTPQARHGKAVPRPRVDGSPNGPLCWSLEAGEPVEDLSELSWELILTPGDYVVLGARHDLETNVGPTWFRGASSDGWPMHRLVILRALRAGTADEDDGDSRNAPLALQAGWTSARASGE